MTLQFIKPNKVRRFARERRLRISKGFIHWLDKFVEEKLSDAVTLHKAKHNGSKLTIGIDEAEAAGIYSRPIL